MANVDHIKRLQADPDGLDFDGLRRQGIELLQALSSGRWTDYNLHDPGVTLLELLCYGLTDLVYRTDFSVADFLTNDQGNIDYQAQALYPPQEVFPNQPVTDLDFCKLIYDRLPDVEDVWVHTHNEAHSMHGLLSVFVKPHESLFKHSDAELKQFHDKLRQKVFSLLSSQRNLCRDIAQIQIVQPQAYTLAGDVEIDDSRPRAEIYADIYFRCAKLITSGSQITRFEEVLRQGMSWEEILTGPLTTHGFIDERSFLQESYDIDVVKLITLIRHIPGVKNVHSLFLIDEQGAVHEHLEFDHHDANCPVLHFIKTPEKILDLRLQHSRGKSVNENNVTEHLDHALSAKSQREVLAFGEQVALFLKKHEFAHDAFRRNQGDIGDILTLPRGQHREFDQYTSLGENLPAIYGINHFGVPRSEPDEVHAKAKQLKAYLYPFEQIMANYLHSLQHTRDLYSVNPTIDRTYFAQFLTDKQISNIKPLYTARADQPEVDAILREQDQFEQRRNRVLDSLLGLYGEVFPEIELRRHDYYHMGQIEQHLIRCKIQLLQQLCELSGGRGAGRNLQRASSHLSHLERRIRILIGSYTDTVSSSLVAPLQGQVKHVSNNRYHERLLKQINVPSNLSLDKLELIAKTQTQYTTQEFKLPHGQVCDALLQNGIAKENYRMFRISEQHGWVCLVNKDEEIWPLSLLPIDEMSDYVQQLIASIAEVSQACEGLHVLEHILLRPRQAHTDDTQARAIDHDFYAHRVSIILPAYTARFADLKTRFWVEHLIAEHLPAHILPDFYWLDFPFLAQFEVRHEKWLGQLRAFAQHNYASDASALDQCAAELIEFLKKNRHPQSSRYWI